MNTRFSGLAASKKGLIVGIRVESGVAVQFHKVLVPWEEICSPVIGDALDAAYRRILSTLWRDDRVVGLF